MEKFCCGAECGITVAGTGSVSTKHWNAPTGVPTVETDIKRTGARAFKMTTAVGASVYLFRTILPAATQNKAALRFYIYFDSLPSADCVLATFAAAAGGFPNVRFIAADSTIQASLNNTTGGGGGVAVTTGQWYRVEVLADLSGGTRTVDVSVNGTAVTQATAVTAASTISNFRVGGNTNGSSGSTANFTHRFDDIYLEVGVAADTFSWPIGAGKVQPLSPTSDGTHSFDTNGDFAVGPSGTTTAFNTTDTTAHTFVDALPLTVGSECIAIAAAAQDEYIELQYNNLPADAFTTVHCVTHVSAHRNDISGTTSLQSLRLVDGGSTAELVNNLDLSETSLAYHEAVLGAPPSGGNWTRTKINGLRTRYAGSFSGQTHDISPVPQMFGTLFEVSTNESGGGSIAFDAYSRNTSTSPTTFSWTHSPVGIPRGVVVYVVQNAGLTDEVTGVTYGGVAMVRVASNSHDANEDGVIYAYFLGENIPTGDQTIEVTVDATGSSKFGRAYTVTAAADTFVQAFDSTSINGIVENPAASLALGGVPCFVSQGVWAAPNTTAGIAPFTDWTAETGDDSEIDFGSQVGASYRYMIVESSDVTFGWTQVSDDALCIAVAIAEAEAGEATTAPPFLARPRFYSPRIRTF